MTLGSHIPQLKIVLLGDESVGKTSLLNKWLKNTFDSNSAPTIGGAAQAKRDQIQGVNYAFQIWDTAGAEKFRALAPLYVRDSKSAAIVFDMTRRRTFESLSHWVTFLRQQGEVPFVLIGNKEDLADQLEVTSEEAVNYAFSVESQFFATSAKSGQNVELAFRQVELEAVELYKRSGPMTSQPMVDLDPVPPGSGGCC